MIAPPTGDQPTPQPQPEPALTPPVVASNPQPAPVTPPAQTAPTPPIPSPIDKIPESKTQAKSAEVVADETPPADRWVHAVP